MEIDFSPHLVHGLRPHPDMPRNAPYMERYTNLMACERRAKGLPGFSWPGGFPELAAGWPPAQGHVDDRVAVAVVSNAFHSLNLSALSSSAISLYSATSPASAYSVNGSGSWHWASFLDMWFATNGTSLVYKAPSTADNKVVGHHAGFQCASLCNWNNRLVLAGLSGSRLSDASWGRFETAWRKRDKKHVVTSEDDAVDATWLLIGPRVGGDSGIPNATVLALLGLPSDAAYTTVFEPRVMEWAERGELDLLPCRFTGAHLRVEVQGGDLLVYGTEGVSRIRETEIGPMEERASPVGIWGRASSGGHAQERVSVGRDGHLYLAGDGAGRYAVDGYYEPTQVGPSFHRLGYAEYLGTLNSGTRADFLHVVHDAEGERYWFSAGNGSYLLSRTGLSHSLGVVPSVGFRAAGNGALLGAAKTDLSGAAAVTLRTVAFDAGRRDPFNVGRIDLTTSDTASDPADRWSVVGMAKLKKQDAMRTFPAVAADVRGVAAVDLLGVEHQYEFTAADRTKVDLDGAIAFVDPPDKAPSLRKWLTVESL